MEKTVISQLKYFNMTIEEIKNSLTEGYLEIAKYLYFKQNGQPLPRDLKNPEQVTTHEKLSAVSLIPVVQLKIDLSTKPIYVLFDQFVAKIKGYKEEFEGVAINEIGIGYLRESGIVSV